MRAYVNDSDELRQVTIVAAEPTLWTVDGEQWHAVGPVAIAVALEPGQALEVPDDADVEVEEIEL